MDASPESVPGLKPHPELYYTDGNVFFKDRCWLYRVHLSTLRAKSGLLRDMFSSDPLTGGLHKDQTEGTTAELAIAAPSQEGHGCEEDFERALLFLISPATLFTSHLRDRKFVVRLLKLADQYEMAGARELAIDIIHRCSNINPHPDPGRPFYLSAAETLALALHYRVSPWVFPAVNIIVRSVKAGDITLIEANNLGSFVLFKLLACKEKTDGVSREVACNAPYQRGACPLEQATRCKDGWEGVWWHKIAKLLLSPEPESLRVVLDMVHGLPYSAVSTIICQACFERSKQYIHTKAPWKDEHVLIHTAAKEISTEFHMELTAEENPPELAG